MAQDKYSQNRQLAYDLLKQEGYTDIGDSAEELFKNKANSELAYKLLSEAGYTDVGKDYNEFASMLYGPETSEPSIPAQQAEQQPKIDPEVVARGQAKFDAALAARRPEVSTYEDAPQAVKEEIAENDAQKASAKTKEDTDFIQEYDRRWNQYQDDTDNDLSGPDVDAEKQWLDENNERYREAKKNMERIEGLQNLATKEEDLSRLKAKKKENQSHVNPRITSSGGMAPAWYVPQKNDQAESETYEAANEILGMAEQTLKQGSKVDPGYEGNWLEQAWTAARQFVEGGVNNFDMGSLTFGLSEGSALTQARLVGDKSNEIVNKTIKDMGYTEEDINKFLQSADEDAKKLNTVSEELNAQSAELETMQATLNDMQKSGASQSEINAYSKKYNDKVKAYNAKLKNEYEPAVASYEKDVKQYETVMSAVDAAVESGLSDGEKALLDALEEYTGAQMKRANDVSVASAAGAGAEQSAEFMLDFILTGGLAKAGTKAATKLTTKHVMRKMGAEAAKKVTKPSMWAKIATDAVVAAERTALMFPRNLSAYGEQLTQMTGTDQFGRYNFDRSHLNAALNTALTQYIEYWSEGFGEYFGAAEQALFKNVTKAAPRTAIGKTLKGYRGSIGTYLDNGKFDGMFNEMLEEVVGSGLNALAGWLSKDRIGDKGALKDFFSGEQLATLALSFLPMSAISAATNIGAYNKMKARYDKSVEALNPFLNSGAINREELDELVADIENKTPEEIKDKIVEISDKARKANGGYLPKDFAQSLMGYVEGTFSMGLNSETWEDSQEKLGVVNAYTGQYDNPDERNAWDLAQLENTARENAIAAGFDENLLDQNAYMIARQAQAIQDENPEQAQVLMEYATAKAAKQGLKDGYDAETAEYNKNMADAIEEKFDINGNVIKASLPNGAQVYITSKDASVGPDGKLNTPTGADGLVSYTDADGRENQAKASTFTGATAQETAQFLTESENVFKQSRDLYFQQAENTISPAGMSRAISQNVGGMLYVSGNGAYEPVTVVKMTNGGQNAVISGDKNALKAIAAAAGIQFPGGSNLEIPVQNLYPLLAKNDDGSISTDQPEGAPEAKEGASQGAQGVAGEATLDGRPIGDIRLDEENGWAYFIYLDDPNLMIHVMDLDEFREKTGMNAAPAEETTPTEETPAETATSEASAETETPTETTTPAEAAPAVELPRTKENDVDWDKVLASEEAEFTAMLPGLVAELQGLYGDTAIGEVKKWYAASKKNLDKAKEELNKADTPAKSAKAAKKVKGLAKEVAYYSALFNALRPEQKPAASAAGKPGAQEKAPEDAEQSGEAPDVSKDTPEAAQQRGYIMQNGQRIDRAPEDAIAAEGAETSIAFTKNTDGQAKAHYGLVDAKRIIPSHIADQENPLHFFAKKWQPKDRKRTDSAAAIQQMANGIRPQEITTGATAYNGAPIVNRRGEVIQGNGRGEALRRAYQQGSAAEYKQWLADHAAEFGLTAEQVTAMENPVLVRVMDVNDQQAEVFGKYSQGDLESGGNQRFNGEDLAGKIGDRLPEFLDILFQGDVSEDSTLADMINENGQEALDWLHRNKFINDTEYQNATEQTNSGKRKFTDESVAAFRELCLAPLFAGESENVKSGYKLLPSIAKLALQRNVAMLSRLDGVIGNLQDALSYYHDYMSSDSGLSDAKTFTDAYNAILQWMKVVPLGSEKSEGDLHPSIVANKFAALLHTAKTIKSLTDQFRGIARAMQGEVTLLGATPGMSALDAFVQAGIITEEEKKQIENDSESSVYAGPAGAGEPGRPGGESRVGGNEEVRTPAEGTDSQEPGAAGEGEVAKGEGSENRAESEPEKEPTASGSEENPVSSQGGKGRVRAEMPKPTTLEEARAYFENLYGKGAKADRYIRVWELTNKKKEAPVTRGLVRQMAATESVLSAEEAAELEQLGIQVAVDTIETDGFVKFADFFKNLVETFGDGIRPYAKSIYLGASAKVSDEIADQMDDRKAVRDFDTNVNINEIGNGQDITGVRQGDERLEPVAGDTAEGTGEESGASGLNGDNTGDIAEDTGAGGPAAGAEGEAVAEQGTLWDTGESDNAEGNGEGNGGGANVSRRPGRSSGKNGRGGRGVPASGVDEGESGRVGREPGGHGDTVDPAVEAEKAEQKAYDAEKKAIENETDTNKLKARKDELKAKISSVEDKNDINRAKMSGQLRAVIEKLRDLFSKSANKSETLNQEKVPYDSISDPTGEHSIGSVVPSGAADDIRNALKRVEAEEGKTLAEFVREELGYKTLDEMFTRDGKDIGLSGEQVDGAALAIHQMKKKGMFIVGDMTGVGKGRQGAAVIRWALRQGKKVLFVTETPDLFADMYKDLNDIGNTDHIPFVINNETIKDKDTEEVFLKAPGASVAKALYNSDSDALPTVKWKGKDKGKKYNFVMMTYSQAQGAGTANAKKKLEWVKRYAKDAIVICDESHNASGESNRGRFFRDVVKDCEGVTFMSATFAKRPDNMILYALRSSLRDANMTQEAMIESIQKYGVPMQEIIASGLFRTGEMIRRERDFSDVVTHWDSPEETFTPEEIEQSRGTYDKTIKIVNDIINFQRGIIDPELKKKNQEEFEDANKAAEAKLLTSPEGTKVKIREYRNTPYSSQVSNIANLMFYAIKAKKAAEIAIEQIKKGEKPIIAVENTLESYIKDIEGDVPSADFAFILKRGLERSLKYRLKTTVKWINPDTHQVEILKDEGTVQDMGSAEALVGSGYADSLREEISSYSTDKDVMPLMLSPIDYVKRRIEEAGYKCGEITGRSSRLIQNADGSWHREDIKLDKTREIAAFNGGSAKNPLQKEDVSNAIILNTAGATGISLHASRRFGDQSKRCMVILQPARNVNTEVQVRGRGDRTGQVSRCEYFYVTSPIPAEKKVIMMLRKKLASLDANAVGTENVSSNKVDADDMDNKYGDEVARQFLIDHPEINERLDTPLDKKKGEYEKREGLLYELLIGIQRMSCKTQEMVIKELETAYRDQIEYLNQNGVNDLSTSAMNLDAVTVDTGIFVKGTNNESPSEFAHDTLIERVEVNVLKKPLTSADIYARMKKLGALTEDGKIDPDYGANVYKSAYNYAQEARRELRAKQVADRALLREGVKDRTPQPEGMSDEEYEKLIDKDGEYSSFVFNQEEEYRRVDSDYISQCGSVLRATDMLKPGMPCLVPLTDVWTGEKRYGRFIGFNTPKDGKPKGIKAVFAVTDARASIEIPVVSMRDGINTIINDVYSTFGFGDELREIGGSKWDSSITDEDRRAARDEWWDKKVPKENTRQLRYMVTGNIFQASGSLGDYKGTITTYTHKDADTGERTIEKGMLLAEDFDPENFRVRRKITKGDVWEGYDRIEDDVTHISARREGDVMVITYDRPFRSRETLKNHPFFTDDELKSLVIDNQIEPYSKDQIRAYVSEENVEAALEHLYKNYGFTLAELFVMPDSTERVDAIVYSGKPFAEVIDELGKKYSITYRGEVERKLKASLKRYKMDINNEDLKKQIQDYVQLRQAFLRREASRNDSIRMAWDVIINDELIAQNTDDKDARDLLYAKREAEKEELAARGIHGTAKHFEAGRMPIEELEKTFYEFNSDKTNERLFKKILPIIKKLNLEVVFNEKTPARVGGHTAGQVAQYNWKYMNAEWITDQMKADTILHELMHTMTAYAKECCDRGYEHLLPEDVIDLISQLDNIYNVIRYNHNFTHDTGDGAQYTDYGTQDGFEMMAEAGSNEDFRKGLRKIQLGVKALSGMLSFSDVTNRPEYTGKKQSAEDAIMERLDALIDAFNEHAFTEFYRGTGYGARNYKEYDEALNKADEFREIKEKIKEDGNVVDKAQHLLGLRNHVKEMSDTELLIANDKLPGNKELEKEIAKRGLDPRPNMAIYTDAFKNWFGDWENDPENASKVVDENGEPMVMYHGTPNGGFTSFDTFGSNFGLFGTGSYFTSDKNFAEGYTKRGKGESPKVYSVFLNIRRPLNMNETADVAEWKAKAERIGIPAKYFDNCKTNADCFNALRRYCSDEKMSGSAGMYKSEAGEFIADFIEHSLGYDGITHTAGKNNRVFIAFRPQQIKSATDNNGEFGSENADIRLREAPKNETERRLDEAERELTNKTLDKMSEELGITINRVPRSAMPKGHETDKGYYNTATGEMTICMDNVTDERDAIATVLHETVGHHGLRKLLGDRFNDAMVRIYGALDAKGKEWVHSYMECHNLQPGDEGIIIGMEEYLSHIAERGDYKNVVWEKIKEILGKIVDALFGTDGFLFTDNELNYILRASYEQLKNPNWLNTAEGKAFDTLLKRQLGINESNPNKPTDPQGPDAGLRFREGDSGAANADYNAQMKLRRNAMIMENQNADLPVKIGMEAAIKEWEKKHPGRTFNLSEDEDYLTRHNLASSRAETESHIFELFHFNPLLEQVRKIQSVLLGDKKATKQERQAAYERVLDYMYAVSGLERNRYKNAEIEEQKQEALKDVTDPAIAAQFTKRFDDMKKDWSGLTSLMGLDESQWQLAEARAQKMVDDFKDEVGEDALNKLWDRVRACTDFSLEHAYKYGLLTRDEFEKLHGTPTQPRMWNYYLPLRGFSEDTAEDLFGYSTFANPSSNNVVVKDMKGRWTEADNPLANILNIAETEIVQGNDNWAKQALLKFTQRLGDNSLLTEAQPWYVKDPATGKWSLAEPNPGESLQDFEARMESLHNLPEPIAKKGRRGLKLDKIMANKAHRNEHLIHLKVDGMDKMIWVNGNPALAKAVTGIGKKQNWQTLRKAGRLLSNLFTTYSLDFAGKNLIRDTIYSRTALIMKEDGAYRHQFRKNWWKNFGYGAFAFPMVKLAADWESGELLRKAPAERTEREQMFIDFMTDGGQTGYTIVNSVRQIKKDLEKSMRRAGKKVGGVSVPILGHYANLVKTLNEAFELLTRFTAYETSRDMGRSGQRAASDAKEISVNFNRRGAQSGEGIWGNIAAYLGATHYFYNAGVQGFDNFLHLYKKSPVKMGVATGGLVLMGVLTPLINGLLAGALGGGDGDGDDEDWYWNLPEWVRRNNLILGAKNWYLAVPLPVEFRAIYGIGDIMGAAFCYDKTPHRTFGSLSGDIISTAAGILPVNPIEGYTGNGNLGDMALRAVAPDAGMFFVDWATNRDYTGRPLWKENPFSNNVPKSQGAYASTPKGIVNACQKLAEVSNGKIDVPPGLIRDFMNNYGGGFFRAAEDASKIFTGIVGNDPDRPLRWDNVPFFSGFTGHIDEDRSNSFASNALREYKKVSEGVVKDLNAVLNTDEVTATIAYETPDKLYDMTDSVVQKARVKKILDSKDYNLGKMYREGMNNSKTETVGMEVKVSKNGAVSTKPKKKPGVTTLKKEWKALREQWAAMPSKTQEEKDAKEAFSLEVQQAWHLYYDAEANLAESLLNYDYGKN